MMLNVLISVFYSQKLLVVNPHLRISAEAAMASHYFSDISNCLRASWKLIKVSWYLRAPRTFLAVSWYFKASWRFLSVSWYLRATRYHETVMLRDTRVIMMPREDFIRPDEDILGLREDFLRSYQDVAVDGHESGQRIKLLNWNKPPKINLVVNQWGLHPKKINFVVA